MKAPPLVAAPLDGVTVQLTPVYTSKEAWFSLADYHVRYRRWLVMLVTSESTSARISPFSRSIPLASFVSRALRESLPLWDLDFLWFFLVLFLLRLFRRDDGGWRLFWRVGGAWETSAVRADWCCTRGMFGSLLVLDFGGDSCWRNVWYRRWE